MPTDFFALFFIGLYLGFGIIAARMLVALFLAALYIMFGGTDESLKEILSKENDKT